MRKGLGLRPLCPRQPPESVNQWLYPPGLPSSRFPSTSPRFTTPRTHRWAAEGFRLPRSLRSRPPHVLHAGAAPPTRLRSDPAFPHVLAATPARCRGRFGAQTVGTVPDFASSWWGRRHLRSASVFTWPQAAPFILENQQKKTPPAHFKQKPVPWPSGKSPDFSDFGSLVCKTGITARFHGFLVKLSEGPGLGAPGNDVCFGFIYLLTWTVFMVLLRLGS